MGLDSYVYRIRKPQPMEPRIYSSDEIKQMGLCSFLKEDVDGDPLAEELLPYTDTVQIRGLYLDMDKVRKDYGLADECYTCGWHGDGSIDIADTTKGQYNVISLTSQMITERYTVERVVDYVVFYREEVAYWRKHYGVQQFFYKHIEEIENTGYYRLDEELLLEFNECSENDDWGILPAEEPTEESALFYWEWY